MIPRFIKNLVAVTILASATTAQARLEAGDNDAINRQDALVEQLVLMGVCDQENAFLFVQDMKDQKTVDELLNLLKTHKFEQLATTEIFRTK